MICIFVIVADGLNIILICLRSIDDAKMWRAKSWIRFLNGYIRIQTYINV